MVQFLLTLYVHRRQVATLSNTAFQIKEAREIITLFDTLS